MNLSGPARKRLIDLATDGKLETHPIEATALATEHNCDLTITFNKSKPLLKLLQNAFEQNAICVPLTHEHATFEIPKIAEAKTNSSVLNKPIPDSKASNSTLNSVSNNNTKSPEQELRQAARTGSPELLKQKIEIVKKNGSDKVFSEGLDSKMTALHQAAIAGSAEKLRILLKESPTRDRIEFKDKDHKCAYDYYLKHKNAEQDILEALKPIELTANAAHTFSN